MGKPSGRHATFSGAKKPDPPKLNNFFFWTKLNYLKKYSSSIFGTMYSSTTLEATLFPMFSK